MTANASINFQNVRILNAGGLPLFSVEDIANSYHLEIADCSDVLSKFSEPVDHGTKLSVVSFEGFEALVALAYYRLGGDPAHLRRYRKLMSA